MAVEMALEGLCSQKQPVEIFSAYGLLHDSQAYWRDSGHKSVDYPCLFGTLNREDISSVALRLIEELRMLRGMGSDEAYSLIRSGFIFGEAASELKVYTDGNRGQDKVDKNILVADTDHPYDKGMFNMSLLFYLATGPFNEFSTEEETLERIKENIGISPNRKFNHVSSEGKSLNPDIKVKDGKARALYNGFNGFDKHGSSIFVLNQESTPYARYLTLVSEARRFATEGEFNIAMVKEEDNHAQLFIETVSGPRLLAMANLGKYDPRFGDMSGVYYGSEFRLSDVCPSAFVNGLRRV